MLEISLVGVAYRVDFKMWTSSYTDYSRGDHGMGGGEYQVRYGTGSVIVHDLKKKLCVAACRLGYNRRNELDDEHFRRCIEIEGLLPERGQDYADWVGENYVERFRAHEGPEFPAVLLEPADRAELARRGFVPDEAGQVALSLSA